MNLLIIKLQAIHLAHNIQRFYILRAGQDLWGAWVVMASYGRIGHKGGHAKKWLCPSKEAAQKKVQHLLHKRLSAEKRIGINYVITATDMHTSLNPPEWLASQK